MPPRGAAAARVHDAARTLGADRTPLRQLIEGLQPSSWLEARRATSALRAMPQPALAAVPALAVLLADGWEQATDDYAAYGLNEAASCLDHLLDPLRQAASSRVPGAEELRACRTRSPSPTPRRSMPALPSTRAPPPA